MKKLITTAFLMVLASVSYGQPSLEETKRRAEQGDAPSQLVLGVRYAFGEGVREDDAEAVKWFRLAAAQGDAAAQYYLGNAYDFGAGVPENDAEAVKWYRLAAAQGDAVAQFTLGAMYADGKGVPRNYVRAYVWFSVAAAQDDANARRFRDIVSERLTPDQLARGQDIAVRCFESGYKGCE